MLIIVVVSFCCIETLVCSLICCVPPVTSLHLSSPLLMNWESHLLTNKKNWNSPSQFPSFYRIWLVNPLSHSCFLIIFFLSLMDQPVTQRPSVLCAWSCCSQKDAIWKRQRTDSSEWLDLSCYERFVAVSFVYFLFFVHSTLNNFLVVFLRVFYNLIFMIVLMIFGVFLHFWNTIRVMFLIFMQQIEQFYNCICVVNGILYFFELKALSYDFGSFHFV